MLEVEALQVRLVEAGVPLVDDIHLALDAGETFALVGESGCGKSMTALALMGLLPSGIRTSGGSIRLQGQELRQLSEREMRRLRGGRLGMVFQEPMSSLNPVLRIGEQIAESVRMHDNLTGAAVDARVVALLTAVGIPDPGQRARAYPHQLSGGMKQRVMIAMALAGRPSLLIADEPTTALDVTIQAQVLGLLKQLQRETGMAILLITHDLGVVAQTADRLAVMYAGQIVETAVVNDFFRAPQHPYSRQLFAALPERRSPGNPLAVIEGRVPALDRLPPGCRFAARCDVREARCEQVEPTWQARELAGVRCFHPGESPAAGAASSGSREALDASVATGQKAILEVRGLNVHFPLHKGLLRRVDGAVRAVDGIDLDLAPGQTLALVGESGCGKSSAGLAILQLIRPSSGSVRYGGEELTGLCGEALRRLRAELQIVLQDPLSAMNPRLRVGEIVAEGMRAQGIDRVTRERRVVECLLQVGLSAEAAKRYPHEFSGGQRQRICIARALAVGPRLIICDEPTSALDVSVQAQILNLLQQLQTELGLAYLFISHDLSVVAHMAQQVAVMYLGRIVEQGRTREVLESPAHPYTQALLAAVPVADPGRRREVIRLPGEMPSPADPPRGCHFHPRCPQAEAGCREAYPESVTLSESHRVSCRRVNLGGHGAEV
ncbi:MAG: ABC transporter ATP-binding protein [Candidatus Thiodiazotropha sp.]